MCGNTEREEAAMKKLALYLLLFAVGLAVSGCQPEVVVVDEAELLAVNSYVKEMSVALLDDTLNADLKGWVREYYEDELPLRFDEERREWLAGHWENLEVLQNKHLQGSTFPDRETIATWEVVLVQGENEWLFEGTAALEALDQLDLIYSDVTQTIEMIIASEGELDMAQSEQVISLVEEIEPRVESVRAYFFR
jgi:hypothetical protein